ncbi:MAG: hypothetical protein ISS72_04255 [Candidatus Brocadiae bacterium]|nr:hypothetical protein [Candidatus Brocadiia bacterium]
MRKLWRKRWVRILTYLLTALCLLGCGLCWLFRISSLDNVVACGMLLGGTLAGQPVCPVWWDLALRRINPGDSVDELIRRRPPVAMEHEGSYTVLYYEVDGPAFENTVIVAKDERLVLARKFSCTYEHTFFDED